MALRLLCVLWLLCGGCGNREEAPPQPPADLAVVNPETPGERVELIDHLAPGRITLFEFYSDQCSPCIQMRPILEFLAEQRRDIAVRKVNIDREGHRGIDFDSPLAEQYQVDTVPSFVIYNQEGRLTHSGDTAKDQVRQWYTDARMMEKADPELLKQYEVQD